jgi:hypothetical protein
MTTRILRIFVQSLTTLLLLASVPTWAQAPSISWSLDSAIRQIERQAKDFETAMVRVEVVRATSDGATITITYTGMARNLDLKPELFRNRWPRGTDTIRK